jgi:myo-inositol-1(or 4)-monophosphatase
MNLTEILRQTIQVAEEAGAFIAAERASFGKEKIEYKGLNNLVSYVDKTAEKIIVEGLTKIMPEAGFITEEETVSQNDAHHRWIIDPLDGTTNFIHGLPVYAVSIALIEEDAPILGVVYEVSSKECFTAIRGYGASLNGNPISVSEVSKLEDSLLATGFPYYEFQDLSAYLNIMQDFMQHTHGLRRMGSAAIDLAYTACGRFDGYFEYNLNSWDVAAGVLLVEEAGGTVSDFKGGGNPVFDREVVAGGPVHKEMLDTIARHWD